jgi:hypothetical protein
MRSSRFLTKEPDMLLTMILAYGCLCVVLGIIAGKALRRG